MNHLTGHSVFTLIPALLLFAACSEDQGVGPQPAPLKPVELRIIENGPTAAIASWKPAADSGSLTGYRIIWYDLSKGDTAERTVTADVRSLSIDSLLPFTDYKFSLAALRGEVASPSINATRTGGVASLEAGATSIDSRTIEVSIHGNPAMDMYRILWKGLKHLDSGSTEVDGSTATIKLDNVRQCQTYEIRVQGIVQGAIVVSDTIMHVHGTEGVQPPAPAALAAAARNDHSIALQWIIPNFDGISGFRISWNNSSGGQLESDTVGLVNDIVLDNLESGQPYRFSVSTLTDCAESSPASIEWATAQRFTTEPSSPVTIRMYENSSPLGSGLVLDPDKGGPRNVSVSVSNTALQDVQLAIYANEPWAPANGFLIGPAHAFFQYRNVDLFDSTVYVSRSTYRAATFNDWYMGTTLDLTLAQDGNVVTYGIPNTIPEGFGHGFVVRLKGADGEQHYARVFIRNIGGVMLHGTAPNRYVELEISYQRTPNLPYGRPQRHTESQSGVMARMLK